MNKKNVLIATSVNVSVKNNNNNTANSGLPDQIHDDFLPDFNDTIVMIRTVT